jgi:chorismate mutase
MKRFAPIVLLVLAVPACRPAPGPAAMEAVPDRAIDRLLGLMRSRLDVMHDVARWKWASKAPIEDPGREAALLGDVADRGVALGLDPAATRAFFAAQIEAAKLVQRADLVRWEADRRAPEGEAPDLARVLRPRIDSLNRDLLAALAEARPRPGMGIEAARRIRDRAKEILAGNGIDGAVRDTAIRPLVLSGE